ncbi:MAG TPA: hypothetical protein VFA15_08610 [Nitrososphaera sp.]|nr:hypothetical protein [Nitrososphaera sp.]
MKNPLARVLIMLAASDVRFGELHYFFRWVADIGPERATRALEELRSDLRKYDDFPLQARSARRSYPMSEDIASAAQRIEKMLLEETRLSKIQAAELLLLELHSDGPTEPLPSYNKISFTTWLEKIAQRVGANKLFQIASRIRNRAANKSNTHWPLKRE